MLIIVNMTVDFYVLNTKIPNAKAIINREMNRSIKIDWSMTNQIDTCKKRGRRREELQEGRKEGKTD